MKLTLLLILASMSSSSFASDCLESSSLEALQLSSDVLEVSDKQKYTCDTLDLVSGERIVGALQKVQFDKANGKVQMVTYGIGGEGERETLGDVLLKIDNQSYGLATSSRITHFRLKPDGSGVLSIRSLWNGIESFQAFNCSLEQTNTATPTVAKPRPRIPGLAGDQK